MTQEQRTAMARIISDMIKADNIIEESEIRDMKAIMLEYGITQKHMGDARNIRFSDAVMALRDLEKPKRKEFFDKIYKIAMSDNACVPKEALLLIALQYCLVKSDDYKGLNKPYLVSCPTGESTINDQYMVYLESSYDEVRNAEIQKNFELLVSMSRLNGFNFVYIPKMVDEFKEMDPEYVQNVIGYMAPRLSDHAKKTVYDRLCKMTTVKFYHSVLYEQLKVKALYEAPPTLLINIGTSVVPYCAIDGSVQYYTEFLCLPIIDDTVSLVRDVLDFFKSKISIHTVTVTDNHGQFKYFGFYKALFDFLIAPPPVAPDLVFLGQDMKDGKYYVAYKFAENLERKVKLMPARYNLYFQVAQKTYCTRAKGLPTSQVDRPTMSNLRKRIAEELKDIAYIEQYKPEKEDNQYSLRLDKGKVFVRRYSLDNLADYEDIPITKYHP